MKNLEILELENKLYQIQLFVFRKDLLVQLKAKRSRLHICLLMDKIG